MSTGAAEEYCRNQAAPAGSNLYYSSLYLSPDQKRAVYALHGFGHEITGVLEECADPGVARLKFAWWQDEIQHLFRHQPRHPVSHELLRLIDHLPLEPSHFTGIIRHYEARLDLIHPLAYEDLKTYLLSGTGELWRLSALVCGADTHAIQTVAGRAGTLFGIFESFQQRPRNVHRDPAATLRQLYAELEMSCHDLPQDKTGAMVCVLIMTRIIMATCAEMLREQDPILEARLSLTPLRKLWIAWRTRISSSTLQGED